MRKWFVALLLLGGILFPFPANAQAQIKVSSLHVELWPEYDQPSMLVISYITLTPDTALPAQLVLHIPVSANAPSVVAVGATLDTVSDQDVKYSTQPGDNWIDVHIEATGPAIQLEYYDPNLQKKDGQRQYDFEWVGDYPVDSFSLSLQKPIDASNVQTSKSLSLPDKRGDGLTYLSSDFGSLPAGTPFSLALSYDKTSDNLTISALQVRPAQPLNTSTRGHTPILSNFVLYLLLALGVLVLGGAAVYLWQSSRGGTPRAGDPVAAQARQASDVYCHQCGTRAVKGDRYCRVCGTKLRSEA
jgi:hypothetical protein